MSINITIELGSGKLDPDFIKNFSKNQNSIYIAVDKSYHSEIKIKDIENEITEEYLETQRIFNGRFITCSEDIFKFVEEFPLKVDKIIANRILEHIHLKDLMYFLFLLHSLLKPTGELIFMVPDHGFYAKEILRISDLIKKKENINAVELYNSLINITTEFCNEASDPHMSIWTEELVKLYLETEGYWRIEKIETKSIFSNRKYIYVNAKPNQF